MSKSATSVSIAANRPSLFHWLFEVDRILRGEATKPADIQKADIKIPVVGVAIVVILLAVSYGFCMGIFAVVRGFENNAYQQALLQTFASMCKVPLLLLTRPALRRRDNLQQLGRRNFRNSRAPWTTWKELSWAITFGKFLVVGFLYLVWWERRWAGSCGHLSGRPICHFSGFVRAIRISLKQCFGQFKTCCFNQWRVRLSKTGQREFSQRNAVAALAKRGSRV